MFGYYNSSHRVKVVTEDGKKGIKEKDEFRAQT